MAAVPMSVETAGYTFTPRQAKTASALEGLRPFSSVVSPSAFSADPLSSYAIADDKSSIPALALAGAFSDVGKGAIQGLMSKDSEQKALEAEERKHQRALEIEAIKSARSSEALQKRIDYLRQAAADRLAAVGANKKAPRRLIGQTPSALPTSRNMAGTSSSEDAYGYAESGIEGIPDPNLGLVPEDMVYEPLPDVEPMPNDGSLRENMPPPVPEQKTESQPFQLTPPFVPGSRGLEDVGAIVPGFGARTDNNYYLNLTDVIDPSKLKIDPLKSLQTAVANADSNAPVPTLPSEAISGTLSQMSLAGPIDISYIPSETEKQYRELQQQARSAIVGQAIERQSALAAMPAAVAGQAAEQAPLKGLDPRFQSGAFANQADAFAQTLYPVPEGYNKPKVSPPKEDPVTGQTYWEVSMPEPMTQAEKAAIAKSEQAAGPDVDQEQKLRKEYLDLSKNFLIVQDAYGNINKAASLAEKNPSSQGAADLALIFSYMKLLDPGSTVREGEFANAQNAAGVPQRVQAEYNRLMTGGRLGSDQRKEFVRVAKSMFVQRQRAQAQLASTYTDLAKTYNVRPETVVVNLKTPDPIADITAKIRQKVSEVQSLSDKPTERQKAFQELQDLIRQQKDIELTQEQEISVD